MSHETWPISVIELRDTNYNDVRRVFNKLSPEKWSISCWPHLLSISFNARNPMHCPKNSHQIMCLSVWIMINQEYLIWRVHHYTNDDRLTDAYIRQHACVSVSFNVPSNRFGFRLTFSEMWHEQFISVVTYVKPRQTLNNYKRNAGPVPNRLTHQYYVFQIFLHQRW